MATRSHTQGDNMDVAPFKEKAANIGEDLRDMASLASEAGREKMQKIRDAATERYYDVKDRVSTWEESLEAYVQEQPLKALLIAAVAGMIFAKLMRKS